MKTIKYILTMTVTQEFYDTLIQQLKTDILNGSLQRELKESDRGIIKIKAIVEDIKP